MDLAGMFPRYLSMKRASILLVCLTIIAQPWRFLSQASIFVTILSVFARKYILCRLENQIPNTCLSHSLHRLLHLNPHGRLLDRPQAHVESPRPLPRDRHLLVHARLEPARHARPLRRHRPGTPWVLHDRHRRIH